jgi:hypothetical protein
VNIALQSLSLYCQLCVNRAAKDAEEKRKKWDNEEKKNPNEIRYA